MRHKINVLSYAKIFKMLLEIPATVHELSEEVGLHHVTVSRLMRCLHDNNVVHITAWEQDSRDRDTTPIYKFGKGRDKPRRKITGAERSKKYRASLKNKAVPCSIAQMAEYHFYQ